MCAILADCASTTGRGTASLCRVGRGRCLDAVTVAGESLGCVNIYNASAGYGVSEYVWKDKYKMSIMKILVHEQVIFLHFLLDEQNLKFLLIGYLY